MNRLFIFAVSLFAPFAVLAQEAAASPQPPAEMPWGALITFLVVTLLATIFTVRAILKKDKDEEK